jgi:hypothetical protein
MLGRYAFCNLESHEKDYDELITSLRCRVLTMKLMVKSAKEMLAVLDETKETIFKDRKCDYPYTEWEHKRAQVKERLHRLPEYVHHAVETINVEEQKMGRPPKRSRKES